MKSILLTFLSDIFNLLPKQSLQQSLNVVSTILPSINLQASGHEEEEDEVEEEEFNEDESETDEDSSEFELETSSEVSSDDMEGGEYVSEEEYVPLKRRRLD